jgi:hypothetical protein
MTDRLIAHAMESGAQTLFVEVNAYVQDYIEYSRSYLDLGEPVFTARLARSLREFGARVTMNFKHQVFGIPFPQKTFYPSPVNGGSGSFDFNGLAVEEYYRILELNPAYPTEIRRLIQAAGASGVDLIFFSPPRPASAVHMLGEDRFARMLAHTEDVADDLGVPLWYSSSGWPDDHFIDIAAHVNARGRDRFLAELSGWYGSRQ